MLQRPLSLGRGDDMVRAMIVLWDLVQLFLFGASTLYGYRRHNLKNTISIIEGTLVETYHVAHVQSEEVGHLQICSRI
jgi:hypothetical protein